MEELIVLEEGIIRDTISGVIFLFVGLGVLILVVILISVIDAKAHSTIQDDLAATIVDANSLCGTSCDLNGQRLGVEVVRDVNSSIVSGFGALSDAVGFLPIIVLALIFFFVLVLLMSGIGPISGGNGGAGAI